MVVHDPLVIPLALEMLGCYQQELVKLEVPPQHISLRPGEVVDFLLSTSNDECCEGLAWVRPATFFPSSGIFPSQDTVGQKQGTLGWAVTLELGIVMCAPTPDQNSIVSDQEWTDLTVEVMDAAAAMRRAICCFQNAEPGRAKNMLPGAWQPIAVQGGCVGGLIPITLRGPACDCPDAGPVSS